MRWIKGLGLKTFLEIGRLTLSDSKKLKWSLYLGQLYIAYGAINMWSGVIWVREGLLKGILLIWDRTVVGKIEECVGAFSIACSFRNVEGNFE
jgi:hypothetical protein